MRRRHFAPYIALVSLMLTGYVAQPGLATLVVLFLQALVLWAMVLVARHEGRRDSL